MLHMNPTRFEVDVSPTIEAENLPGPKPRKRTQRKGYVYALGEPQEDPAHVVELL